MSDFNELVASGAAARTVDARDAKKAGELFTGDRSVLQISLGDLSADMWSLLPGRAISAAPTRYRTMAAARSRSDAETSRCSTAPAAQHLSMHRETLARRKDVSDDDNRDYDVVDYNIDLAYSPLRQFLNGVASVRLRVRGSSLSTISLRLSDALVVRSITSDRFGRLFGFRVNRQNVVVINLPAALVRDTLLTLTFVYSGRLEAQTPDGSEAIGVAADGRRSKCSRVRGRAAISQQSSVVSAGHRPRREKDVPPSYARASGGALVAATGIKEDARRTFSASSARYLAFLVSSSSGRRLTRSDLAISIEARQAAAFADRRLSLTRLPARVHAGDRRG